MRKDLKELSKILGGSMTLNKNVVVQVLVLVLHILMEVGKLIPSDYQIYAWAAQSVVQTVLTVLAGNKNPDGSPAEEPYSPKAWARPWRK